MDILEKQFGRKHSKDMAQKHFEDVLDKLIKRQEEIEKSGLKQ